LPERPIEMTEAFRKKLEPYLNKEVAIIEGYVYERAEFVEVSGMVYVKAKRKWGRKSIGQYVNLLIKGGNVYSLNVLGVKEGLIVAKVVDP